MKKFYTLILILFAACWAKAQVHPLPDNAYGGYSLNVTFTADVSSFSGSTAVCMALDTSNILFVSSSSYTIHASSYTVIDSMHLNGFFNIPVGAPVGNYTTTLGVGCQLSTGNSFTINDPTLFTSAPGSSSPGEAIAVTFTDAYNPGRFYNASTNCLHTDSTNIIFTNVATGVSFKPSTSLTETNNGTNTSFSLTVPPGAPFGIYDIIAGLGSLCPLHCAGCLQVSPTFSSHNTMNPIAAVPGQTLGVTLTDDNYIFSVSTACVSLDTSTIVFTQSSPNYGFTFHSSGFTTNLADSLIANITIPANAPDGLYNVYFGTGTCAVSCQACFKITSNPSANDLVVHYTTSPLNVRPGVIEEHVIQVTNNGINTISPLVVVNVDPLCNVSTPISNPAFDSIVGNKIYYTLASLAFGYTSTIHLWSQTNASSSNLGLHFINYATVNPMAGDFNPADNADTVHQAIVNSYDPNAKYVFPSDGITQALAQMPLDYTVEFQNTGTAPAINIVVVDTLSNNLDLSTFKFISSSHYSNVNLSSTGVLTVTFHNIMLPDSNANEAQSHGFFRYQISPQSTLTNGDAIFNTANIYFDNNSAVVTNTTVTYVGSLSVKQNSTRESFTLYPNPTSGSVQISGPYNAGGEITVLDLSGREISKSIFARTLNLENILSGMYFVIIRNNEGLILSTQKLLLKK